MKSILLIITSVLLTGMMYGQYQAEDKVIMLDNTVHEGIIIEQKPGEHIKILRIPQKDTLTLSMESIDRIEKILTERTKNPSDNTRSDISNATNPSVPKTSVTPPAPPAPPAPKAPMAPVPPPAPEMTPDPPASQGENGIITSKYNSKDTYIMLHGLMGGGDYAYQGLGLSAGKIIKDTWQIGMSIHYMGQTNDSALPQRQTFPLAVDLRRTISRSKNGRTAALVSVSTGYNFTINGDYFSEKYMAQAEIGNGFYFNPALAFRFNTTKNTGLMVDVGYQLTTGALIDTQSNDRLESLSWSSFLVRGSFFF